MHPLKQLVHNSDLMNSSAKEYGTPLYIYDASRIRENVNIIKNSLEKYFDKKVTTVVNNSYELARNYVEEVRNKIQSEIILIAFDVNKSAKYLSTNPKEFKRFLATQKMIRGVDAVSYTHLTLPTILRV